ncbi:hypothetical protein NHQ30_005774 [Ciborinia camelliae]|nr:hypothetical protein NHQ30_005774 [Ciborinia camelliae]
MPEHNDLSDWEQQSALMADIYAGSLLNIAAAHGWDSQTGLFNPRNTDLHSAAPEKNRQEIVPIFQEVLKESGPAHELNGRSVFIRSSLIRTHDGYFRSRILGPHSRYPSPTAPLDTRGWVYQERALSRRTISFYETEIIWECMEEISCECNMISTEAVGRKKYGSKYKQVQIPAQIDSNMDLPQHQLLSIKEKILKDWYGHVKGYADLRLTKEEDRLPGISGIASRTFDSLNRVSKLISSGQSITLKIPQYVAGMWSACKIDGSVSLRGVIWHSIRRRDSHHFRLKRPDRFVAPTWSWASVVLENIHNDQAVAQWLEFHDSWLDWGVENDHLFAIWSTLFVNSAH